MSWATGDARRAKMPAIAPVPARSIRRRSQVQSVAGREPALPYLLLGQLFLMIISHLPGLPFANSPVTRTGAANLKFLSPLRQVDHRNFKFKAAPEINKLLELL